MGRSKRQSEGQDFGRSRTGASQEEHEPEMLTEQVESGNEHEEGRNTAAF